jgi:hypothetical protein
MREKCRFLCEHVEIAAILAVFCGVRGSNGTARYSLELAVARNTGERTMRTVWKELEANISRAMKLPRRAVAVGFLDAVPEEMEQFKGTEPSGCSFWRLAAAGKSFYTVPQNHFDCAVGAYTHNIPLSAEREKETKQTMR